MRPVKKWNVGHLFNRDGNTQSVTATYSPYTRANAILQLNLDHYCSYCETFSSDLEVEHIISQNQDNTKKTEWENFLLACGRCNGKDNKSNKHVDLTAVYLPHLNNTLYILEYKEGGFVGIHPQLNSPSQINKVNGQTSNGCSV